jgi:hypothetical protein
MEGATFHTSGAAEMIKELLFGMRYLQIPSLGLN